MDQRALDRFQERVALFRASPVQKFMRSPWRMAWSFALDKLCLRRGSTSPSVARTFWGAPMNVVFPEQVSESIYRYEFFEEGLTAVFIQLLRPGMMVFDIGAHFGYFSLLASELVGDQGQVHSFEPTPSTFKVLSSNAGRRANVTVNNVAVFSEETELQFQDFGVVYSSYNSLTQSRLPDSVRARLKVETCNVKAVTIDEYTARIGGVPDFIKIDAENAELAILQGMQNVLRGEKRPMITLEVGEDCVGAAQSGDTVQYLMDRDYRPFEYHEPTRRLRAHEPRNAYGYDNLVMVPAERVADLQLG